MGGRRLLAGCSASVAISAALVAGCSSDPPARPARPDRGCQPSGSLHADACTSHGLPADMPCEPGERALESGACQPAGVPAERCATGFVADDRGGCAPVVPSGACPPGQIAVPGDAVCRPVAPCGSGAWGDIPVDAAAELVDGAYSGSDSDGSAARPWTSIQQAIDAAASGAIVAIAAGSYAVDLVVDKPVRLWGVCPASVEIVGQTSSVSAIQITAAGTEVRDLAVRGSGGGVVVDVGTPNVVLDRLWVHDTAAVGVRVRGPTGPVVVGGTLIEGSGKAGIAATGADITFDGVEVRDAAGYGLEAAVGLAHQVSVRGSRFERNSAIGIALIGSRAAVEATSIEDTRAMADGEWGLALGVQFDPDSGQRADLTLVSSVLARNRDAAIVLDGADGHLDATVVSGTLPRASGLFGSGLVVRRGAVLEMSDSLVDANRQDGISVIGAAATLDGVLVRDTQPNGDGKFGEGIGVDYDTAHDLPATLTLRGSVLDANHLSGLIVIASEATVETSLVEGTLLAEGLGRGIDVQIDPTTGRRASAVVRASLVENNLETNVCVLDADLTLESSVIRGALPAGDGRFGDGLAVVAQASTASAVVQKTRIQTNARAGLLNVAAAVGVGTNLFGCNGFDLEGEDLSGNAYSFERLDANHCGCDEVTADCQVLTSGLEAPALAP